MENTTKLRFAVIVAAALSGLLPTLAAAATLSQTPTVSGDPYAVRGVRRMTPQEAINTALIHNFQIQSLDVQRAQQRFAMRVTEDTFVPDLSLQTQQFTYSDTGWPERVNVRGASFGPVATLILPTGGSASVSWQNGLTRTVGNGEKSWGSSGQLVAQVVQPFLKGGGLEVGTAAVRQARLAEAQNILGARKSVIDVVTQTLQAYYGLIQAQKQVNVTKQAIKSAQATFEQTQTQINAGRLAPYELDQARATLANQQVSLESARNNERSALIAFLTILGVSELIEIEPDTRLTLPKPKLTAVEAIATALEARSDHRSAQLGLQSARISAAVAENNTQWDLSASVTAAQGRPLPRAGGLHDSLNTGRLDVTAKITLSVPLPGRLRSTDLAAAQARAQLKIQEIGLSQSEQQIRNSILQAITSLESTYRQIDLAREAVRLAELNLTAERRRLAAGQSTNFQVSSMQLSVLQAQTNLVNAEIGYLNALAALDQARGTTLETWNIVMRPEWQ